MKKILIKIYQSSLRFKDTILPKIFVFSPFFSSLYYLLFSTKFKREQHAVLKGKLLHLKELKSDKANIYTLIRNIHRLEKGLLMKPRRDVFAVDFIAETVDAFLGIWTPEKIKKDSQYKWFYDVLNKYFSVLGKHPLVDNEKKRFLDFIKNYSDQKSSNEEEKSIPYYRQEANKTKITFEEFYNLTKYRRSVRWFLNDKVPHDLIDKAVLAANQSPSACNRQPFEFKVIDDPVLLKEVANLPMGARGYVDGIPMIIVIVGNLDAYFDERDRHIIYIDGSLASMTFMLGLETLGLSSCAINWPDIERLEKKMEKTLKLEKYQRPIMCMAVGFSHPEGKVAYSEKRSLEHIRKYN